MNPKKKPAFMRQEWFRFGNSKKWTKWRKPRGNKSKLRRHFKEKGFIPSPGYGAPAGMRMLHPSGLQEARVSNIAQLEGLDMKRQAIRITGSVGGLKRFFIQNAAKERGLRVLNPIKVEMRAKQKKGTKSQPTEARQKEEHRTEHAKGATL